MNEIFLLKEHFNLLNHLSYIYHRLTKNNLVEKVTSNSNKESDGLRNTNRNAPYCNKGSLASCHSSCNDIFGRMDYTAKRFLQMVRSASEVPGD